MSQIKNKDQKPQISRGNPQLGYSIGGDCDQYPTFSFRHLTANSKYNFGYFNASQSAKMKEAKHSLYDRIEALTRQEWKYWGSLGKANGYETIEFSRLKLAPIDLKITKDNKIYIFRFEIGKKSARIIGYKKGSCPIIHVIGYDFDFSAYDHG